MNLSEADRARLELAQRAFKAAEPSAAEVQTGVRRARLWLGRPKRRRPSWFSKGLVFVVLALGSLAYAKPQALADLVEKSFTRPSQPESQVAGNALAVSRPEPQRDAALLPHGAVPVRAPTSPVTDAAVATPGSDVATPGSDVAPSNSVVAAHRAAKKPAVSASAETEPLEAAAASAPAEPASEALSEWGRVGQALAHGDESSALTALDQLSQSDDPRTRDKADLGRAQLFMAHGNREQACALAKRLTQRSAGSRIERQALALLKSCSH